MISGEQLHRDRATEYQTLRLCVRPVTPQSEPVLICEGFMSALAQHCMCWGVRVCLGQSVSVCCR